MKKVDWDIPNLMVPPQVAMRFVEGLKNGTEHMSYEMQVHAADSRAQQSVSAVRSYHLSNVIAAVIPSTMGPGTVCVNHPGQIMDKLWPPPCP